MTQYVFHLTFANNALHALVQMHFCVSIILLLTCNINLNLVNFKTRKNHFKNFPVPKVKLFPNKNHKINFLAVICWYLYKFHRKFCIHKYNSQDYLSELYNGQITTTSSGYSPKEQTLQNLRKLEWWTVATMKRCEP